VLVLLAREVCLRRLAAALPRSALGRPSPRSRRGGTTSLESRGSVKGLSWRDLPLTLLGSIPAGAATAGCSALPSWL
jgi:hypothetical protein